MQRQRLIQINDSETLTVGQMGILRVSGLAPCCVQTHFI